MEVSVRLIGIRQREWAVVPPFNRLAAMPEVATAMASSPAARTVAKRKFSGKEFPQPVKSKNVHCYNVLRVNMPTDSALCDTTCMAVTEFTNIRGYGRKFATKLTRPKTPIIIIIHLLNLVVGSELERLVDAAWVYWQCLPRAGARARVAQRPP